MRIIQAVPPSEFIDSGRGLIVSASRLHIVPYILLWIQVLALNKTSRGLWLVARGNVLAVQKLLEMPSF